MKALLPLLALGLFSLGCGKDGGNDGNPYGHYSPILTGNHANYWGSLRGQVPCTKGNYPHRMEDLTFKVLGGGGGGGYAGAPTAQINGHLQFGSHPGHSAAGFFGQSGFGDLIYVQAIQVGGGQMLYNVALSLCIYRAGNSYSPHHGGGVYGQQPQYGPGGHSPHQGGVHGYEYVGPTAGMSKFSFSGGVLSPSVGDPFRGNVEGGKLQFFSRTYNGAHFRSFTRIGVGARGY